MFCPHILHPGETVIFGIVKVLTNNNKREKKYVLEYVPT